MTFMRMCPAKSSLRNWIPRWLRETRRTAYRRSGDTLRPGRSSTESSRPRLPSARASRPARQSWFETFRNLRSLLQGPPYRERKSNIVYVGLLTELRGLREMMQAVGQLSPDLEGAAHSCGPIGLLPLSGTNPTVGRGAERTVFLGELSRDRISELLSYGKSRHLRNAFRPQHRGKLSDQGL